MSGKTLLPGEWSKAAATGAAAALATLYVLPAASRILESVTLPLPVGLACSALLAGAAAWALKARRPLNAYPVTSYPTLARRAAGTFPFVQPARASSQLPSLGEWLAGSLGTAGSRGERGIAMALEAQLTRPWNGLGDEPRIRQVLLVLFALHATDNKAYEILRDLVGLAAREAATGSVLDAVLGTYGSCAPMQPDARVAAWIGGVATGHAWSETVLMACLSRTRAHGKVLACTEFGWLMDIDRPLALALNAVGRPSFLPESLGAACHYLEEERAGVALPEPAVGAGVRGILRELDRQGSVDGAGRRG